MMSREDTRRKLIEQTIQNIDQIRRVDTQALNINVAHAPRDVLMDAVAIMTNMSRFYGHISSESIHGIPTEAIRFIETVSRNDRESVEAIFAFHHSERYVGPQSEDALRVLVYRLEEGFGSSFQKLVPYIGLLNHSVYGYREIERSINGLAEAVQSRSHRLAERLDEKIVEANGLIAGLRSTSAELGVSKHATFFEKEASGHESHARSWLWATIFSITALVAFALYTLFLYKDKDLAPSTITEMLQLNIGKIMIFAAGMFLAVHCARMYSAHRHNFVINRHRQNALSTYTALVQAASDVSNRDIVLVKAAESIFDLQPTGYSKVDGGESGGVSLVNIGQGAIRPPGHTS